MARESEETMEKLWKSRKVMLEVLEDRGFCIPETDKVTFEEFMKWTESDSVEVIKKEMELFYTNGEDKIIVLWPAEPKLGTNMREIYSKIEKKECNKALIVVDVGVTHWAKEFIKNLERLGIRVDYYEINEAQINITKHVLQPKFLVCSKSEKEEVLKAYSLREDQIPQMKNSDPVARHFGVCEGDLIKIIRDSETQPGLQSISYRIVSV